MAVGQAADTIRYVTGLEPDVTRMRDHFLELIGLETAGADRNETPTTVTSGRSCLIAL